MATRLYGVSVGQAENLVSEGVGSAVAEDTVEVTVELATSAINHGAGTRGVSKAEVLEALEKIQNHIIKSNWPPA
jgi:hypothetical protein